MFSISAVHLRWDSLLVNDFLEHMDHVVELSVDITNDDDRLLDTQHIRLVACTKAKKMWSGDSLHSITQGGERIKVSL